MMAAMDGESGTHWDGVLAEALRRVRASIAEACERSGRDPATVGILAVTKTQPPEAIQAAVRLGLKRIGENRVQEARDKAAVGAYQGAALELIGPLQSNKIKVAVTLFEVLQSLEDERTARELERRCRESHRQLRVLIEVNTSGEESKHGVRNREEALRLAEVVLGLGSLRLEGLMTLGPLGGDESSTRRAFASLRELREWLQTRLRVPLPELSMGMSADYPWAVLEGSTLLRLGTALFGGRV